MRLTEIKDSNSKKSGQSPMLGRRFYGRHEHRNQKHAEANRVMARIKSIAEKVRPQHKLVKRSDATCNQGQQYPNGSYYQCGP